MAWLNGYGLLFMAAMTIFDIIHAIMLMVNKKAQRKSRKSQSAYTIPLYLFCDFFMKPIDSTDNFVYNVLVQ